MVWFQCEDCGDNLKKPKLANHFRFCSAFKLSCIDCGEVFGQHSVESHTQCITEAEKYGPKGEGKASNGASAKPKEAKQKPDVDINVGLSDRPPWFCSLCNTKATSKQALLLHADGKKHRAKARAIHFAKQQSNDAKDTKDSAENNETLENKDLEESKDQNSSKILPLFGVDTDVSKSNKKRKLEAFDNAVAQHKTKGDTSAELTNGGVLHNKGAEVEASKGLKKAKHSAAKEDAKLDSIPDKDPSKKEIKWKKLISSALKSNTDGVMKLKKLKKYVLKSIEESGVTEDKKQLSEILDQKIASISRFVVDGKCVRLATAK